MKTLDRKPVDDLTPQKLFATVTTAAILDLIGFGPVLHGTLKKERYCVCVCVFERAKERDCEI